MQDMQDFFCWTFHFRMGSKMFLLLVLMLLFVIEHSQGVPETRKQSSTVSTFNNASAVGDPLTTRNPVKQHTKLCSCRGESGKGREPAAGHCLCQQFVRRSRKPRKSKLSKSHVKTLCQKIKNKNLRWCKRFSKHKRGGKTLKLNPSVPI